MHLPLLLTASVATRGMKGACFTDVQREQMYVETLAYYLRVLPKDQPIVFAENSGWNLAALRRAAEGDAEGEGEAGRVEWIAVDPALSDQSRGKGYNELILIDEAVRQSKSIRAAGAFMKVTGRYPIYNLMCYLSEAREFVSGGGKFYGDIKDHRIYDWLFPHNTKKWNGHAAYTVLFAATLPFYRQVLSPLKDECNDATENWIENVWYRVLKHYRAKADPLVRLRFRREPVLGGLQGSMARTVFFSKDNCSVKARLARQVGNLIRIFLPGFWF